MINASFSGIWPAMLTPLQADLRISHEHFAAHARSLLEAGCGGVTPFGTTGEGPSFGVDERIAAVDALVAGGVPADRIIVSTSCAAITEVVTLTRHALSIGAHGCLMLPPFYFKGVSDEGVADAYRYVIDQVGDARLRLYLYNLPQVCSVPMTNAIIDTLCREYPEVIVGIKDSQCERPHSLSLVERFGKGRADGATPGALGVYVGNELDLRTLGRLGSKGAISGLANFWPRLVAQLVSRPDAAGTEALHQRVQTLLDTLGGYALIPALKVLMAWRSSDDTWLRVRPPLRAVDAAAAEHLRRTLTDAGITACDIAA